MTEITGGAMLPDRITGRSSGKTQLKPHVAVTAADIRRADRDMVPAVAMNRHSANTNGPEEPRVHAVAGAAQREAPSGRRKTALNSILSIVRVVVAVLFALSMLGLR